VSWKEVPPHPLSNCDSVVVPAHVPASKACLHFLAGIPEVQWKEVPPPPLSNAILRKALSYPRNSVSTVVMVSDCRGEDPLLLLASQCSSEDEDDRYPILGWDHRQAMPPRFAAMPAPPVNNRRVAAPLPVSEPESPAPESPAPDASVPCLGSRVFSKPTQ